MTHTDVPGNGATREHRENADTMAGPAGQCAGDGHRVGTDRGYEGHMTLDLLIRNGEICSHDRPPYRGHVGIKDGRIVTVTDDNGDISAAEVLDAEGRYVMPGMIDPHIHIGHGDPHREEFWREGCSAIIGGVTSMFTYYRRHPFNYLDLIPQLIRDGEENSPIDFLILLPLFTHQNLQEIDAYVDRFGVRGFKFFPGIKGDDAAKMTALPHTGPMIPVDDAFVLEGMRKIAKVEGGLCLYHAENPDLNAYEAARIRAEGRSDLLAWCHSRPDYGEAHSVRDGIWWQRLTGCPLYIVHLSSAIALEAVLEERQRGPKGPLYVETCPQFLTHTLDSPIGTIGKMSPPFRTDADCSRLWLGIKEGSVDTVGSDHGAFRRDEKNDAWSGRSGFPGMATILPALITYGVKRNRLAIQDIVRVFSTNPARIFGVYPRKGILQPGADADIIAVNFENEREVDARHLASRSDFSIYEGQRMVGWPEYVVSGGRVVLRDDCLTATRGTGRYLGLSSRSTSLA